MELSLLLVVLIMLSFLLQMFVFCFILGGTIDVTSYQIQNDSELKELHIPSGGPWGGTCVDREYLAFLENLFGRDANTS
jgi:hypothetical protein